MDRIAFVIGSVTLYWSSVILCMSILAAICFFLAFYLGRGGSGAAAAITVPVALALSVFLARLAHWYFRPDSYPDVVTALTDYTTGGYALLGAFAGCILTALLLRGLQLHKSMGTMLDAMSLGGCAGIALGRLACFFSAADRGRLLQTIRTLPWAYPVTNTITGAQDYRLATFLIQAMAVGVIFLLLVLFAAFSKAKKGDIAWIFILLYSTSQIVLDSTRYDSLFMRSNGFVSVVQILAAVGMVLTCIVFSVRQIRGSGFRATMLLKWLLMAALLGGAGYMEYYVQRHGDLAEFSYGVMTLCLCLMAILALHCYAKSYAPRKQKPSKKK